MTAAPSTDNSAEAAIMAAAAQTPERKRFARLSYWFLGGFTFCLMGTGVAIAGAMAELLTDHATILLLAGLFCGCGGFLLAFWHYATRAAGHGFWRSFLPPLTLGLMLVLTGAYIFYADTTFGPLGLQ